MSILIKYGDVAVGAKEDFTEDFNNKASVSNSSQVLQSNLTFPNYGNPCELYSVGLEGDVEPFPSDTLDKNIGYISEEISDENYNFNTPIILTLVADELYTSSGITFAFDVGKGIFASALCISWYRDSELLAQKEFRPDNAFYFCKNKVDFYNKIVVEFTKLNMPNNRLRIQGIEFGYLANFAGEEIINAQIYQAIEPLSTKLIIGSGNFTLASAREIEYSFQARQPLKVYFNDVLISTLFAKSASRRSKNIWDIKAEDYISVLETVPFYGGVYYGADAYTLLEKIFNTAKVPYFIDEALKNVKLYGYIPLGNCRGAAQQVAFASQCVIDTNYSDVVQVKILTQEISQTLPLERISLGQSFEESSRVSAVSLTAHSYTPMNEVLEVYSAENDGTGEDIFVKFPEPLHNLSIVNGDLVLAGTNFAKINAREDCVLSGCKYKHNKVVKTKTNPLVLTTDTENVISITNATLISLNNVDSVLEKCYNYYTKNQKFTMSIYDGKHENAGIIENDIPTKTTDFVEFETEYLGTLSGTIIEQSFALSVNTLKKDTVLQ